MLRSCQLEEGVAFHHAVAEECVIGQGTRVGPFAYIRPGSVIGSGVKVGDFVEIKNSRIGDGSKVPHLAYVGDAKVGTNTNIGCGVITANYDGKKKSVTEIGNDAFIGSNCNLVAPVKVGDGAYVAAGSTITDEVPPRALAIARSRQTVKVDWRKKD
jgi:bifunctional UDP-N-acetylglucosamine pyrophosphorylase/glucosamine-1-phosphate N-acetyltransferase